MVWLTSHVLIGQLISGVCCHWPGLHFEKLSELNFKDFGSAHQLRRSIWGHGTCTSPKIFLNTV